MRYWIICLGLICSLSACRLSFGSSSNPSTPTSQPGVTQPSVTVTQRAPATATPTLRPTNTPPKVNTTVPVVQPPCQKQTSWPTYVVVSGDTLGKIAQRTNSSTAILTSANCLANADQISVGQTLYVPQPPVSLPPTAVPNPTQDYVVASLPANPGCYLQIYGMMGNPTVYAAAGNPNILGSLSSSYYYRIYSQTPTFYALAWNTTGETGWVEKTAGSAVGDCRVLTQGSSQPNVMNYDSIAFEYPSNWYSSLNIDGLPGGYVGSIRVSDMPAENGVWGDMVIVGFTLIPDGIVPADLETAAREALKNALAYPHNTLIQDVTAFTTTSGLNGYVFDFAGLNSGERVYYFHLNGKTVVMNIQGNRMRGEQVVNTLRGI